MNKLIRLNKIVNARFVKIKDFTILNTPFIIIHCLYILVERKTHLTLQCREDIEYCLNQKMTFNDIDYLLNYHRTSIVNEVKNRRVPSSSNIYETNFIFCEFEQTYNHFKGIECKKNIQNTFLKDAIYLKKHLMFVS